MSGPDPGGIVQASAGPDPAVPEVRRRGGRHRLFFALWPDDAVRAAIAGHAVALRQRLRPRGHPVSPQRYHLTLQFLGEFDALPAALAERAMSAAARVRAPAFELRLDRTGSFDNRSIPWWLGCGRTPGDLLRLWDGLGQELGMARVEVRSANQLRPHVTILRDAAAALPAGAIDVPVDWHVDAFVLIHSAPGAHSEYRELGRWPLSAT